MRIRTDKHMTITEAHPNHGMDAAGLQALDRGGNAAVWPQFDRHCPLCRQAAFLGECIACGAELAEAASCSACVEPERFDDHVCGFVCEQCRGGLS